MSEAEQTAAWRTIDANFNRAVEGLRVVEDHARFVLGDAFLSRECKALRHDLTSALSGIDPHNVRLVCRDTLGDVGTSISTPQEAERHSAQELAAANWQRASQALRVIEEFAKLISSAATSFEQLRYRSYTLAKAFAVNERSRTIWEGRHLYMLIDGGPSEAAFAATARELIPAGVHVLQLRDKHLDDRQLLERAKQLRRLIDEAPPDQRPLFIMNDRPDIAILARADGVHVGQEELPVSEVRRLVGPVMQIGVSTHSLEQARAAVLAGADYLGCGPTFASETKSFADFPGLPFLRQLAAEIALPSFAIGGITADNLAQVLATGMTRVAVSGAILTAADRHGTIREFLAQLDPSTRPHDRQ